MGLKGKTIYGVFWSLCQQGGIQVTNLFVQLLLMRILEPRDFGLIALVSVFILLGNVIIDGGLTSSLIRTKKLDDADYSSVFILNVFLSLFMYVAFFFLAPLFAAFYDEPLLTELIRVLGLVVIVKALMAIQATKFTINMDFRKQFFLNLPATIVGGLVGFLFASRGFGVWSLVFMTLSQSALATALHWLFAERGFKIIFRYERICHHFSFGYKLLLSSVINIVFQNIYNLAIGKVFTVKLLGLYNRAELLSGLPSQNISMAINKVTYPMFSKLQDDDFKLYSAYRNVMQSVLLVVAPLMVCLIIYADDLFSILFSGKWDAAVPYFKLLCVPAILYPLQGFNLNILTVKGRSDLYLRLEVAKKLIIAFGLIVFISKGIYALIYFQIAFSVVAFFINSFYAGRLINYSIKKQVYDIFPILGVTLLSGFLCYFIKSSLNVNLYLNIIFSFLVFLGCYIFLGLFLRLTSFRYLFSLIKLKRAL